MTDESTSRIPIIVPDLGVGEQTIRVSAWLVDIGQPFVAGDRLVELLVPGITFDVATDRAGELSDIIRPVDAPVKIGEVIGWIEV